MKKIFIAILTLTVFSTLFAGDYTFSDFKNSINLIKAQPKKLDEKTTIKIIHPMVKIKDIIFLYSSQLDWKDGKCKRTVKSFKQIQGQPVKRKDDIGKTFPLYYPSKDLVEFIKTSKIKSWKKASNLKSDDGTYNGFTFKGMHNGKWKNCNIYLNSDGSLHGFSLGFNDDEIKKGGTIEDPGIAWYFEGKGESLKIVKVKKGYLKRSNGIPNVTVIVQTFSDF